MVKLYRFVKGSWRLMDLGVPRKTDVYLATRVPSKTRLARLPTAAVTKSGTFLTHKTFLWKRIQCLKNNSLIIMSRHSITGVSNSWH